MAATQFVLGSIKIMHLSVIVPTLNRYAYLANMLTALTQQTLPQAQFEVIVVDNGSSDDTAERIKQFSGICNLRYHFEPNPGLHNGRHAGMKLAKSAILVFADDDIEPLPTWLEGIHDAFKDPGVVLVGGNVFPKFEISPPSWVTKLWCANEVGRHIAQYSVLEGGKQLRPMSPYLVFGCNFSIRKAILHKCGGFCPDGMPKDKLQYRGNGESNIARGLIEQGYCAHFVPQASVTHCVSKRRLTKRYLYQRAFNEGVSESYAMIRNNGLTSWRYLIKRILRLSARAGISMLQLRCLALCQQVMFIKGFWWHYCQVRQSPALLQWVIMPGYVDECSIQ